MNKYEQLEKLQELKEKGTLSEMEFEIEKNKILNSQSQQNISNENRPSHISSNTEQKKNNDAATTGLILGIIGILVVPLLFGLAGVIFSGIGLSKSRETHKGHGNATAGLILGIINIIWGFFWFALING